MRAAAAVAATLVAVLGSWLGGSGPSVFRPHAATGTTVGASAGRPSSVPSDPHLLVADLDQAQTVIDTPSSSNTALASAGGFDQLATHVLLDSPRRLERAVLAGLSPGAQGSMRTDLAAASALDRLNTPRRKLPPWKIISPPAPPTLLGYLKAAQSRYGVPWEYLAAIEFIETKFGRVAGLSTAGAEGPMQFEPATWAQYGQGDVHNPHDAILGAARYLVANGAPGDMPGALYAYNPSGYYISAVTDYAGRMRSDPRAFYGYYYWQVIYAKRGGDVLLPVGFPRVRPVPLGPVLGR